MTQPYERRQRRRLVLQQLAQSQYLRGDSSHPFGRIAFQIAGYVSVRRGGSRQYPRMHRGRHDRDAPSTERLFTSILHLLRTWLCSTAVRGSQFSFYALPTPPVPVLKYLPSLRFTRCTCANAPDPARLRAIYQGAGGRCARVVAVVPSTAIVE